MGGGLAWRDCNAIVIYCWQAPNQPLFLSSNASTYGAAGAFIIIFVWVYYWAQILLLGAELAKAHGDQKAAASVAFAASN